VVVFTYLLLELKFKPFASNAMSFAGEASLADKVFLMESPVQKYDHSASSAENK
jgi:hypothetical protein